MDLPLPKFAAHVMATSPPAGAAGSTPKSAGTLPPTLGSVPTTPVTPDAPKRPSQSPLATTASLASVPSLKSPTHSSSGGPALAATTTPTKALNSKTDSNTSTAQPPLSVEASGNAPHDPRLLLQVAPHPKSPTQTDSDSTIASGAPNSPAKKKKGKGGISSDIEVSDISDSEECGVGLDDLDSRLKAFTKNYEAWQGTSTKFPPAVATAVTPSPAGRSFPQFFRMFSCFFTALGVSLCSFSKTSADDQ